MLKKLLMLLTVLLLLTSAACAATLPASLTTVDEAAFEGDTSLTGVLSLPEGVTTVGSRAFAATGLHALLVPEGCQSVASDALEDSQAAYILFRGAQTTLTDGEPLGISHIFGPEGGSASEYVGFYALDTLTVVDGLYYSVTEWEALPLCAVDGAALSGTVTVPKTIGGVPVQTLGTLSPRGMGGVTELLVPDYLTIPTGMPASAYEAMTVSAPVPDVAEVSAGNPVVFTTESTGSYGEAVYIWVITCNGQTYSDITGDPSVTFYPTEAGELSAHVTVMDTLNDEVLSEESLPVTVTEPDPVYRAVLVGNVYTGESVQLDGCDTDVNAMYRMLSAMNGTPYQLNTYSDLSATGITSAISSVFSSARSCDVSLFYFSGHGTSSGQIVGTGNTTISPAELRACLDQIPGRKIIIIDACYSGNMISRSVTSSPADFNSAFISAFSAYTRDNLATEGYTVMTSCSSTQMSQTLTDGTISFGAFTYSLCYGSGFDEWNQQTLSRLPADANGDRQITLSEAYAAACERVEWLGTMATLNQSAQYYGSSSDLLWSTTGSFAAPLEISTPTADASEIKAGQAVEFTARVSGIVGGEMYDWHFFLGDEEYTDLTSEPVATFFPEEAGELTAFVTVTDPEGAEATSALGDPVTVHPLITCDAPEADVPAAKLGNPITWTVSASNVIEPAFYEWTIRQNGTDYVEITTDPTVTFWTEAPGEATASVTIQDALNDFCISADSAPAAAIDWITINAPVAASVVKVGTPVTFTTEAANVYGAAEYMWAISISDTVYTEITSEPTLTYIPEAAGTITALVGVKDELGDQCSSEVSEAVTICERVSVSAPIADANVVKVGTPVTFTTEAANVYGAAEYMWAISVGETVYTEITTAPTLTYTPDAAGTITALVGVRDELGDECASEVSEVVTICERVTITTPVADANVVKLGTPVTFSTEAANIYGAAEYMWAISIGDTVYTEITSEPTLTYIPEAAGTITALVGVRDELGDECASEASEAVTICELVSITAPVANANVVKLGTPVTFSTEAAYIYGTAEYMWAISIGNTVYTEITSEPTLTYIPEAAGTITALVGVKDELGDQCSSEVSEAVTICERVTITTPITDANVVKVGTPITFSTEAANVYGTAEYMWAISIGDTVYTEITSEPTLTYTPEAAGTITALVGVRDELGDECASEASEAVTILERVSVSAPIANANVVKVGTPVTFTTEAANVYGAAEYMWAISIGDTVYTEITTEPTLVYTPEAAGTITAIVGVKDELGDECASEVSEAVTILERVTITAPIADANVVKLGTPVTFSTEAANVYGAAEYMWAISIGDTVYTEITTEPTLVYTPEATGTITALVGVRDELGDECASEASEAVTICERVTITTPIADANVVKLGTPVTFTTEAANIYGAAEYMWAISIGETVYTEITTEPTLVYTPDAAGTITALVGVRDELGDECASEVSEAVTICERVSVTAPIADANVVKLGTPIIFSTEAANIYGAAEYMWAISIGDTVYTEITTAPTLTYTPDAAGTITALVGVKDELGDQCSSEVSEAVTILERVTVTAPVANANVVKVGTPVTFSTEATNAYGAAEYTWTITLGEEITTATTTETTLTYTPTAAGEITATVTVKDELGDQCASASSKAVTILERVSVTAPVADLTEVTVGDPVVFTAEASNVYGEAIYLWIFDIDGAIYSDISDGPTITFLPEAAGQLKACVTVVDGMDDQVDSAFSEPVTVLAAVPVYRAMLVGNIYEGQSNTLKGCDTDVAAMRTILSSMTGTPYQISSYIDLSATGITDAILNTFGDAKSCDVSLFHYSGHGTSSGSLVGTGSTYLTVAQLRACLDQIPGTKIIIVDACYSGNLIGRSVSEGLAADFTSAFISGFSSYTRDNLASNGYIVMTACTSTQQSQTVTDGAVYFGAFTYGVCYGSGFDEWNQTTLPRLFADTDSNSAITLSEAYTYACKRVDYLASMVTMDQSAQYYGDDSFVLWSK